jgi:hypothetical protein
MGINMLGWKGSESVYLYDISNVKRLEVPLHSILAYLRSSDLLEARSG